MGAFFIYIIKVTFCLTLFYTAYKVWLSNETFFRFNRKILLLGMIVSLSLPFIKIQLPSQIEIPGTMTYLPYMLTNETLQETNEELLLTFPEEIQKTHAGYSFRHIYPFIYWIGFGISFLFLFHSVWNVLKIISQGGRIKKGNKIIILSGKTCPPFNWWNYIILPKKEYDRLPEEVVIHEMAHSYRYHSLDLLFMEMIILFHWFNPVVWLLKRELQDIHEYEADSEVLKKGIDATRYQLLLVKKAVGSSSYTLANSFNQSKLKKRISMMCKKESNSRNRWKVMFLLPVVASILFVFACSETDKALSPITKSVQIEQEGNPYYFEKVLRDWMNGIGQDPTEITDEKIYISSSGSLNDEGELYYTKNRIVPLFINSENRIMYNGKYYKDEKKLSSLILADLQTTDIPFIVCYDTHSGTSPVLKEKVYQIIRDTFIEEYDTEVNRLAYLLQRNEEINEYEFENWWLGICFTDQSKSLSFVTKTTVKEY